MATEAAQHSDAQAERMRHLAQRCRDLSEITALPEMSRELVLIAQELEHEAELATPK